MRKIQLIALSLGVGAGLAFGATGVFAADHLEAPGTMADTAADITDVFAWHAEGKLVVVVDYDGLQPAGSTGTYDADVLYGIHIDNDDDNESDVDVWVRYGQNSMGEWGVQVSGLPGGDPVVDGPVDTNIDAGGGLQVYAGPREDPFFFDLDGFKATLMSGTVMFDSTHDTFAASNVTAIVVEMDAATASGGSDDIRVWATTGRLP
jgi:hypothetical protein